MRQALFEITFYLAAPFWALMIFAPGWSWTRRIIGSPLIVVPPLAIYLVQVGPVFGRLWAAVSRPDLEVLRQFLGSSLGAAGIWAHLIAFDLFVGRWMYLDSRARGIHPLVMAPVLVLTILLSPIGTLAYLVIRAVAGRPGRADAGAQLPEVRAAMASGRVNAPL